MRDPTIHPEIGDRVYGAGESRKVISRTRESVIFVITNVSPAKSFMCWLMTWRDWCRNKNVAVLEGGEEE